uniref:Uncharacterized protein n=1 Tax=viral metagenome TaxID=1070528 RepID=A0A6C0EIJ6_9ZZZZ
MRELVNSIKLSIGTIKFLFILNILLILYIMISHSSIIAFNVWIITVVQYFMFKDVIQTIVTNTEISNHLLESVLN